MDICSPRNRGTILEVDCNEVDTIVIVGINNTSNVDSD